MMSVPEDTLAVRLKNRARLLGMSDAAVARASGLEQKRYNNYANGTREPDLETLRKIARALQTTSAFLLGETSNPGIAASDSVAEASYEGPPGKLALPVEEYVHINAFNVQGSAGNGRWQDDEELIIGKLAFQRSWIKNNTRAGLDQLAVIKVNGDSMEPYLADGDTVLVDMSDTVPRKDGVYVLNYNGELVVKRLVVKPALRRITVISDNSRYEPYDVEDGENFRVVGKVIWRGGKV